MSSTNKTTYYDLSQYIGTDKPTYLSDYNSDMSKIDGAIHGVQETATTANQTAGSADAKVTQVTENVEALKGRVGVLEGNVSNLQEKVNSAIQSEINSAKQKAESANTTANNALQSANTANTKIDSAKFNGWKTFTNAHSNISTIDNAKIMFNRQLNLLAFEINLTTMTGLTESDIAFRLPVDIPNPNKTVRIRSCCHDLLNDTGSGFDKIAIRDIVIDTDGYLHIAIEGNSRLYCSGVFAVDAW